MLGWALGAWYNRAELAYLVCVEVATVAALFGF